VKNGTGFPGITPEQGSLAFSSDGTQMYFLDAAVCTLSIFRVDPVAGLVLENTRSNVMCGEFTVSSNLLYFDNGFIYDPAAGQRASNSFSLTPPSFVVPRGGTHIDVLNRTNGAWMVRRLSAGNLAPIRTVPIDAGFGTPLEMVAMDANTVAIRTSGAGARVLLVDVGDSATLTALLTVTGDQLMLSFYSVQGESYRIERSPSLINPTWTTVRDNIAGTGGRIDETILAADAPASF
jgi:hypothetical protein